MSDDDESPVVRMDSVEPARLPYTLPYMLLCGCTWGLPFVFFIAFLLLSYSFLDEKKLFTFEQPSTAHQHMIITEESPCKADPYLQPCPNDSGVTQLQFQVYYDRETVECLNFRQLPVECLPWEGLDPKPPKNLYDCVNQCEITALPQQAFPDLEDGEIFSPSAGLDAAAYETNFRYAKLGSPIRPAPGQQPRLSLPLARRVQPPPPSPVPAPVPQPPRGGSTPAGPLPAPAAPGDKLGCHHGFELQPCTVADMLSSYYDATQNKCFLTRPNGTTCYGAPMPLQDLESCQKACPSAVQCQQSPVTRKCTIKDKLRSAFFNPFIHMCQDLEIGKLCLGGDNRFVNFSECENACLRRADDDIYRRRSGHGAGSRG